jgi:nucleoside 2-deoxyribosyltransferase
MLKVFTVMPFSEALDGIWKAGIEGACQTLGYQVDRADSINRPGFIVNQIYDLIADADVIIGEMTGANPNVFYEIGFAHALGKETILLATSRDDLNVFDLAGRRHFL